MNHTFFDCQELKRFLGRQWHKFRGILSTPFSEDSGALPEATLESSLPLSSPKRKRDNVVRSSTDSVTRRSPLSKGPMDPEVIEDDYGVTDIVSIIDTICENLTSLLDAGHGYRKYYVSLLEALLRLLSTLKDVERGRPDVEFLRRSGVFSQLKVSVSITFALVEKVSARLQLYIFFFQARQFTCMARDPIPGRLNAQVAETKLLWEEIVKSFEVVEQATNTTELTAFKGQPSHAQAQYGINKMTVSLNSRRSTLVSGEKITFQFRDSQIRVLYTVQTWLNNPTSHFHSAKRLSASVACMSGRVFNIGVPGYPNKETDSRKRTALIVSDIEDAQVRSFLPVDNRASHRGGPRKSGALLQDEEPSSGRQFSSRFRQNSAGELLVYSKGKSQDYRGEIDMSNMLLRLDNGGQTFEVRRLSLEGKKEKTKVWYKCCVELTGEVLAIYRQRPRSRIQGRKDEGIFHTLGIGNHPELRDLIVCSFVAMGLNSFL